MFRERRNERRNLFVSRSFRYCKYGLYPLYSISFRFVRICVPLYAAVYHYIKAIRASQTQKITNKINLFSNKIKNKVGLTTTISTMIWKLKTAAARVEPAPPPRFT